jgi:hypothetical protein
VGPQQPLELQRRRTLRQERCRRRQRYDRIKGQCLRPAPNSDYDLQGNGRQRITESYNQYVSRIVGANVGDGNQSAGSPGSIDYSYGGPVINPTSNPLQTPMDAALTQVWAWFASQCGGITNGTIDASKCPNSLLFPGGSRGVPGFTTVYNGRLKSPNVGEITVGYGAQIGQTGYAKVDLISRDWKDFYASELTTQTPKVNTPLGIPVDQNVVINSNNIKRTYRRMQLQAQWHPQRWNLGANYTYLKLRGNDEGETGGSGPVLNTPLDTYYPEFLSYQNRLPVGYVLADQRHRARAWVGYDFSFGAAGTLNLSGLESYDSGRPYPTQFTTNTRSYRGAPANPGYVAGAPSTANYYICRDCNRFAASNSTDLAAVYDVPVTHVHLFVRGVVTNVLNNHALCGCGVDWTGAGATTANPGISTQVLSSVNTSALQPFNPFTTTPVEGTNYSKASNFGQAISFFAYQASRTYGFSVGARF